MCLEKLNDEQIWLRAGDNSNAVGNLCLHLAGNVRQWIMHGVAGQPDLRHRDEEFAARGQVSKAELWQRLNETVQEACAILEQMPAEDLTRVIRPQNCDLTRLEGLYHVVEHFAQHTARSSTPPRALRRRPGLTAISPARSSPAAARPGDAVIFPPG